MCACASEFDYSLPHFKRLFNILDILAPMFSCIHTVLPTVTVRRSLIDPFTYAADVRGKIESQQ